MGRAGSDLWCKEFYVDMRGGTLYISEARGAIGKL